LIDTIIDSISKTVDEGDHEVHQCVIKCIITIVSTFKCQVHESTLLIALWSCYKIYLCKFIWHQKIL